MPLLLALLHAFSILVPPPKPTVTVSPTRPVQGSLLVIRALPEKGDSSVTKVAGQFAGEPLHFYRDSAGAFVAYAGVPVEARGTLSMPLAVERADGVVDSIVVRVAITSAKFGSEKLSVDPRFTQKPDSALAERIARESEAIRQAWLGTHGAPRLWQGPFQRPRTGRITSVFGTGREFNGEIQSRHLGVDFNGNVGATIRASNTGVVTLVGEHYYSGNIVIINHGGGIATAYLHLSKVLVTPGDTVSRGQLIGLVGSTGRVTGPHLHWIAKYGSISVNPMSLLAVTAGPRRTTPPGPGNGSRPAARAASN